MRVDSRINYKVLFDEATRESRIPGSRIGSRARNAAEIVNATAKAAVALVAVYGVLGVGRVAGFAQGLLRGVTTSPKA